VTWAAAVRAAAVAVRWRVVVSVRWDSNWVKRDFRVPRISAAVDSRSSGSWGVMGGRGRCEGWGRNINGWGRGWV
jgi:hypothetical protein